MREGKVKDFFEKYGLWTVLGSLGFLLIGLLCFVLGYGLSDGWAAVAAWFSSEWAMMVYVFAVVYFLVVILLWRMAKWNKKHGR